MITTSYRLPFPENKFQASIQQKWTGIISRESIITSLCCSDRLWVLSIACSLFYLLFFFYPGDLFPLPVLSRFFLGGFAQSPSRPIVHESTNRPGVYLAFFYFVQRNFLLVFTVFNFRLGVIAIGWHRLTSGVSAQHHETQLPVKHQSGIYSQIAHKVYYVPEAVKAHSSSNPYLVNETIACAAK